MLLPQSSAFAALKNRLNSVSAIGLLHTPPSTTFPFSRSATTPALVHSTSASGSVGVSNVTGSLTSSSPALNTASSTPGAGPVGSGSGTTIYPSRLSKPRTTDPSTLAHATDNVIRWTELLDKFRNTQEKQRRRNQALLRGGPDGLDGSSPGDDSIGPLARRMLDERYGAEMADGEKALPDVPGSSASSGKGHRGGAAGPRDTGQGGRPGSAASGRFGASGGGNLSVGMGNRLTPGGGLAAGAGTGAGQTPSSGMGHRKSKSTFGRLNLGGKGGKHGEGKR